MSGFECKDKEGNDLGSKTSFSTGVRVAKGLFNAKGASFRGDVRNKGALYFVGYFFANEPTYYCDVKRDPSCLGNLPVWGPSSNSELKGSSTYFFGDSKPIIINGMIQPRFSDQTFIAEIKFSTHFTNMLKVVAGNFLEKKPTEITETDLKAVFGEIPTPGNWKISNLGFGQEVFNPNEDGLTLDDGTKDFNRRESVFIGGNLKEYTIEGR